MRRRIVIEVDSNACFDAVAAVNSDFSGIADRLSVPLLTGDMPTFLDAIGLAHYGVAVISVETLPEAA